MSKRNYYKRRCMIMACDKKPIKKDNSGIYFNGIFIRLKTLIGENKYTLEDNTKIKFVEEKDDN